MKKVKVSELPVCETLTGMKTLGVDANNRSVQVSLEFVETKTNEAVQNANDAAAAANQALQGIKIVKL